MKRQLVIVVMLVVMFVVVLEYSTQVEAMRPFPETVDDSIHLMFQALQRGPVRGSGRNGCTNIPRGSRKCRGRG
ncbi:unnamed protein product [Cochlearia groenlandica]